MKLYSLTYNQLFKCSDKVYQVFSSIIRVSTTSIVVICIDQDTKQLVQLDANFDVELITND